MLINNIKYKDLNPENYLSYTEVFKYGVPKHGGLAIGLERIVSKILGLENVREATTAKIIAGGLIEEEKEVNDAINSGASYVTTSNRKLW